MYKLEFNQTCQGYIEKKKNYSIILRYILNSTIDCIAYVYI